MNFLRSQLKDVFLAHWKKACLVSVFFVSFAGIIALGYQIKWMGFAGKTLWDWLEIAVVPIFIAGSVFFFDFIQKRNDILSSQRELENQKELSREQFSRDQFDSFLSYFQDYGGRLRDGAGTHEAQVIKFKTRAMFRTMSAFWIGEVFDFLSQSSIVRVIPDIFDENEFKEVNISHAALRNVSMKDVRFFDCTAQQVVLSGGIFRTVLFNGTRISGGNFSNASFRNVRFDNCDLTGLQCNSIVMASTDFLNCILVRGRFSNGIFQSCLLQGVTLDFANIDGAAIRNINLRKCSLISTDFSSVELLNGRFTECQFNQTNFENSKLSVAQFEACKFIDVDLSKVYFLSAKFVNCDFSDGCILPNGLSVSTRDFEIGDMSSGDAAPKLKLRTPDLKVADERKNKSKQDFKNFAAVKMMELTAEDKALASIRKLGMQVLPDGKQEKIIELIFDFTRDDRLEGYDRSDVISTIKMAIPDISNSRVNGVINILIACDCLILDGETKQIRQLSTGESSTDWIERHDDFLRKKFSDFGATFK